MQSWCIINQGQVIKGADFYMKIFGSSINLSSFEKYCLSILKDGSMEYERALPGMEVFLGEVFRRNNIRLGEGDGKFLGCWVASNQLYLPEMDNCRELYGENGLAKRLNLYFPHILGHIIQAKYFPLTSPLWRDLERLVGYKFDYNDYYCPIRKGRYCPALEIAANLFEHALRGSNSITLDKIRSVKSVFGEDGTLGLPTIKECKTHSITINAHKLRYWFYQLWGQRYQWGSLAVGSRKAETNGFLYFLDGAALRKKGQIMVPLQGFLEAHGYKVKISEDNFQYWK